MHQKVEDTLFVGDRFSYLEITSKSPMYFLDYRTILKALAFLYQYFFVRMSEENPIKDSNKNYKMYQKLCISL